MNKKLEHIYAISTAIVMVGCLFAPVAWIFTYGVLDSMTNEDFYRKEIKQLSNGNLQD